MRRSSFLPLSLVLLACTGAPASNGAQTSGSQTSAGARANGQDWSVTYDLNSWGRPMAHWRVNGDGSGEVWRAPGMKSNFSSYDLEKYRLRMGAAAMTKFIQALDPLQEATRSPIKCETTITDQPYGTVIWRSGEEFQRYDFNFGCTSDKANAAYDLVGKAHETVEKLADVEARPYQIEHIGNR